MLSNDDLLRFLQAEGENEGGDLKRPMLWDGKESSAGLTKDIIAFANSRNGGVLIIGKEENPNGSFEFSGLSVEEDESFETTKLATWLNNYCEPSVSLVCYHLEHYAKRFVIIEVREFDDVPIICTKSFHLPQNSKKHILREGAIYLRNKNAESKTLQTAEEFRSLIGVAVQKKGDDLITSLSAILKGRSPLIPETVELPYESELSILNESFSESIGGKMDQGGWSFHFHPTDYEPERFEFDTLESLIRNNAVRISHDTFPGSYKGYAPTEWGVYNDLYGEAFGLTPSGLFAYQDAFRENRVKYEGSWSGMDGKRETIESGNWIEFKWSIIRITEMFLFMSRFAHEYPPATELRYEIKAEPLRNKQLATLDGNINLDTTDPSRASGFVFEKTVLADSLKANWKDEAVEAMTRLFRLFPDFRITKETLDTWLEKLVPSKQ